MSQVVRGLPMALAATSLQFLLLKAPTKGVISFQNGRVKPLYQVIASLFQQMLGQLQDRPWVFHMPSGKNVYQVDVSHSFPSIFFVLGIQRLRVNG